MKFNDTIRVLVVDDHDMVRMGLRLLSRPKGIWNWLEKPNQGKRPWPCASALPRT